MTPIRWCIKCFGAELIHFGGSLTRDFYECPQCHRFYEYKVSYTLTPGDLRHQSRKYRVPAAISELTERRSI